VGGLRWPEGTAIVPLARLELFGSGLRLCGSLRLLKPLLPTWEVRYDEIKEAGLVRSALTKRLGVRFQSDTPGGSVVFWTSTPQRVLAQLSEHGVGVTNTVAKLPFTSTD